MLLQFGQQGGLQI